MAPDCWSKDSTILQKVHWKYFWITIIVTDSPFSKHVLAARWRQKREKLVPVVTKNNQHGSTRKENQINNFNKAWIFRTEKPQGVYWRETLMISASRRSKVLWKLCSPTGGQVQSYLTRTEIMPNSCKNRTKVSTTNDRITRRLDRNGKWTRKGATISHLLETCPALQGNKPASTLVCVWCLPMWRHH